MISKVKPLSIQVLQEPLHREWLRSKLAYHDVTAFGYKYGQMAGQHFTWISHFVRNEKVLEEEAATTHVGLITTGDNFIMSEEKVAAIQGISPVLAVEWKGMPSAHAAGRRLPKNSVPA